MIYLLAALLFFQATPPDRVIVEPSTVEVKVAGTHDLAAYHVTEDGQRTAPAQVLWYSTNELIATVNSEGVVTAVGPGTTDIVALVNGQRGYATVRVPSLPPADVALTLAGPVYAGLSQAVDLAATDRLGEPVAPASVELTSSDPAVLSIDGMGRVVGHEPGTATLTATAGPAQDAVTVTVQPDPEVTMDLVTDADLSGVRTGDVVRFRLDARGADGGPIEGVQPAWMLAEPGAQVMREGTEGVFVADEPGTYTLTAVLGPGQTASRRLDVAPRTYEHDLITVGRGPIDTHNSGDMWVFEGVDGRDYVYVGTFMHDWMKVWDVTDATAPVLTDSLQLDARRINDVKIHPNGRLGIVTREGASSRRNGIVLLDLSDPAHPTILSEYTDTVTGGVHNVWILGEHDLVYAIHNGTSDVHILDIADPANVQEVGRWGLDKERKTLHDVIVQDGYAYLSYWDDGLIILDAGAGTHGGTPQAPTFVSQYKYPIGNTHVAWREGDYVFVGDEIFPEDWRPGTPIEARGYIHVVDVSDIDNPVEVAHYEVPEAGAHNVWTDDGKLYVGYYQGGLRVVDITGELRGDLYEQGREIGALKTIDANAYVPNWPMTWGAQVYKGRIYSSDMNSGIWITRLTEPGL